MIALYVRDVMIKETYADKNIKNLPTNHRFNRVDKFLTLP